MSDDLKAEALQAANHREWKPGQRVLWWKYAGTLLAPTWEHYAWVLLDIDRAKGWGPISTPVDTLKPLDETPLLLP